MQDENQEVKELRSIPFPDARTAYQLRRMKDKIIGTVVDWTLVQKEYWLVVQVMEDLETAADRNAAFILWTQKNIPDVKIRNEVWRRVETAFTDPDRPTPSGEYFEHAEYSPIIWAKDVVERDIRWLWPGRVPLGKQTTLAGPGGVGKSFLLCDMAARVSSGQEWPFSEGEQAPVGNVLIISGEDEIEDTIRPRLRLQGADLDRIAFPTPAEMLEFNLSGPKFKEVADRMLGAMKGVSLLIIDPPSSFLAGIDENSNAEVRGMLTPMKIWAHENNCAVIFNTHINKGAGKKLEIQQRVIGSVAMVNGPRMSHMVTVSEDDHEVKLFVPLKSNIWQRLKALSFRIVPDVHEVTHARLEWIGEVDIDAGDAVNGREEGDEEKQKEKKQEKQQEKIENWLIALFKEKPIRTSNEVVEMFKIDFKTEIGATFERAKQAVGIKSRRYGKTWEMFIGDEWVYSQY